MVRVLPAGCATDMRPPWGRSPSPETEPWWATSAGPPGKPPTPGLPGRAPILGVEAARAAEGRPGAGVLLCPDCGQNYCRADWRTHVLFDEGFYDSTMARCPTAMTT